jgi:uncharacterized membrane protein YfhO
VYVTNNRGERQNEGIRLPKFTPNQFQFHIHSPEEGRLQLFQQYNHNWHVKVNGQAVTIEKSNIAFMSVKIPAGNSLIEWEYKPKKVYAGIVLSALTLLSILLYFLIKRKAKQL